MTSYMDLLGMRVRDRVTEFEGVVTSICFDLYGCVQALVHPGLDKEGKPRDQNWYDAKRLTTISGVPVMTRPTFADVPGGQDKPAPMRTPLP